jgi:ADP-ribose pyrophosphatase YjhB (NUDIX family)
VSLNCDRQKLLAYLEASVENHDAASEEERRSRTLYLKLLPVLGAFSEVWPTIHPTASALVIDGAQRLLLHAHKRSGLLLPPGGHLEEGEWPWEAAARECKEEVGLRPDLCGRPPLELVFAGVSGRGHIHLDVAYRAAVVTTRSAEIMTRHGSEVAVWLDSKSASLDVRVPVAIKMWLAANS